MSGGSAYSLIAMILALFVGALFLLWLLDKQQLSAKHD
jgi:hypothetical protein